MVESSPKGIMEYYASQALSPAKYEEHKQLQALQREENVIHYFRVVFLGQLTAHLHSRRDYRGMRAVLPMVFQELLDQTFFQNWLMDPLGDSEAEQARFRDAVERALSDSEEWQRFLGVLDQLARKAGSSEVPSTVPFAEILGPGDRLRDPVPEAVPPKAEKTPSTRKLPGDYGSAGVGASALGSNQPDGAFRTGDDHVDLLLKIVHRKQIPIETWITDNKFGRTTIFDWMACRRAGTPLKGKVSAEKTTAIEGAIERDAKALGLIAGTASQTNSD